MSSLAGDIAVSPTTKMVRKNGLGARFRISIMQLVILVACLGLWEG